MIQHIDSTDRYSYYRLTLSAGESSDWLENQGLLTAYIHKGSADVEIKNDILNKEMLVAGEGFVLTPGYVAAVTAIKDLDIFFVTSKVDESKEIIEIIDDGYERQEEPIENYKIIREPKRVKKPWGHELWVIWTRDYHVLKQIGMVSGNKSSLQLHEKKLETNYMVSGEADVVDGYKIDVTLSEDQMNKEIFGINFEKDYIKAIAPGDYWTSEPGIIHRVISKTDYLAYEVSTPELDDVIRLQDDTARHSGRIAEEHR